MDNQPRPSWLEEPCPPWCARVHHEDDHLEDRRHQSAGSLLVVQLSATEIPAAATETHEIAVHLDQPIGGAACWLRVESVDPGGPRLAIDAASSRQLAAVMTEQSDLDP